VEVVGFCDQEINNARALQQQIPGSTAFDDVADLLRLELDAVHVLTPPSTHAEVATTALEHGVHVLVEKPMATTRVAAERMHDAATRAGRMLCVDHNRLFDPPIVRAQQLVAAGAIGRLLSVEAYQGVNAQEGGTETAPLVQWLNLGPHALYLLRHFVGEITDWQAYGGPVSDIRALFRGTQALGALYFSPATMPYLNALALYGTDGTLHVDLNTMTIVRRRERRLPKMLAKAALNLDQAFQLIGGTVRTMVQVASGRLGTYPGIGRVIRGFYDALGTGHPPPITASDGRRVVELLEDIWERTHPKEPTSSTRRRWAGGWLPARTEPSVLVTGAGGFLGRRVVSALLQKGHRVRAFVHTSAPPPEWIEAEGLDVVSGALGNADSMQRAASGMQVVVHCAARVTRRGSRAEFFRDNVTGTTQLWDAAVAAGVGRFVHVSSVGIYGANGSSHPIHEDTDYDPHPELRGAYAWSKVEADRRVRAAGLAGRPRVVIIRPGILVGAEGPRFTARLVLGSFRGRLVVVGHPGALLPLCHVDDAAAAVLAAIDAPHAEGAYNIVDDELSQEEWLRNPAGRSTSTRPMFLPPLLLAIPAAGLEFACRITRRPAPPLSRYKIRRATESLRYDTSRARRDLKWAPTVGVRSLTNGAHPMIAAARTASMEGLSGAPTRGGVR
jgi:nucleoside-diphosphate-sugar epimerase/predicted dehydrogenase